MTINSKITWTSDTWNPWHGCKKVSAGCTFCYMYRDKRRYGKNPAKVVKSHNATFKSPLKKLKGPLVFTCSWSDFFIDIVDDWRPEAWEIIRKTPHLIYQILTKRPERIESCLPSDWGNGWNNVWLGVTIENQAAVDRAQILRQIPAAIRFISHEPMLEPINMGYKGLDWAITGGESGTGGDWRPAQIDWFRRVRDRCLQNKIAYFHKQNGGNRLINGVHGGDKFDNMTWHQFPKADYSTIEKSKAG